MLDQAILVEDEKEPKVRLGAGFRRSSQGMELRGGEIAERQERIGHR
ncbi:MAG: hypothetical protein ACI97A_001009 [Planctomycetota bacterium]|jgi:hypothetical protein